MADLRAEAVRLSGQDSVSATPFRFDASAAGTAEQQAVSGP
jgi:hypothetical protein